MASRSILPKEQLISAVPFRITRNGDVSLQEDQAADLMRDMEEVFSSATHRWMRTTRDRRRCTS